MFSMSFSSAVFMVRLVVAEIARGGGQHLLQLPPRSSRAISRVWSSASARPLPSPYQKYLGLEKPEEGKDIASG